MASETEIARENYLRFSYARDNGHIQFINKADMCDNYFAGQQWDEAIVRRLERLGKPVITINKVLSTCAVVFGEQLSNRADVSFRPAREGQPETAEALDKVWLHISASNNLDWLESEVAADGFIRGRGFYDVRINFDDQLMGEVRISQLNSKSVVIDPDASEYDPDGWKEVFVTKWLTANDVDRMYGRSAAEELKQRPNTAFTHTYDTIDWLPDSFAGTQRRWGYNESNEARRMYRVIERQYRDLRWQEMFVDPRTGDMREIPSSWSRERIGKVMQDYGLSTYRKRVERIRWVTTIDDLLLHHAVSPYLHFTPVPYFPYFRHGRTIGIVENLISPQDLLNKSVSQELHIVNTTANSGWALKAGALANMTMQELEERGGEDGLVIAVNGSPSADIIKLQPNQVPSGLDRLSFKADEALKEVSMISDSQRGMDRADVAAKAIKYKQAAGSVSLAKPFENLAQTRKILARNVLALVQGFYTEERTMNITGRNLIDQPQELVVNQRTPEGEVVNDLTIGEYTVVISTVPARETFEQTQFEEALALRQQGVAIPDDILVESSHLSRKGEIAKRIKELNGSGEPSQQQQRMAELDMQLKEMEAQEKQAEIQVKASNAQLNSARAQKEMQPEGDNGEAEMLKLAMERERMMVELQMKREQMEQELELEWRKFEMQQQLEKEKVQGQIDQANLKAQAQVHVAAQKAETDRSIAEHDAMHQQEMSEIQMHHEHSLAERNAEHEASMADRSAAHEERMAERGAKHEAHMSEREAAHKEGLADRAAKTQERIATTKAKAAASKPTPKEKK